jgi:hypothetical protein
MEAHDEWQVSDRRYLSEDSMTELYKKPDNNATKELDTPEVIDQPLPAAA